MMPFQFYHSTVQYEQKFKDDIAIIRDQFHSVITNLAEKRKYDTISEDCRVVPLGSIKFEGLTIDDYDKNDLICRMQIYDEDTLVIKNKSTKVHISKTCHIAFSIIDNTPDTSNSGELQYIVELYATDTSTLSKNIFRRFFFTDPEDRRRKYWTIGVRVAGGWVYISEQLYNRIDDYIQGKKGFPSYSSGNFGRMLYFSSTTITTLGYGDILPITTFARILVSLEAIWGTVLLGLFLNALANKIVAK
jgi:hypothetical protein